MMTSFTGQKHRILLVSMFLASVSMSPTLVPFLPKVVGVQGFSSLMPMPHKKQTYRRQGYDEGCVTRRIFHPATAVAASSSPSSGGRRWRVSLTGTRQGKTKSTTAITSTIDEMEDVACRMDNSMSTKDATTLQSDHCRLSTLSHPSSPSLSVPSDEPKSRRKSLAILLGYCSSVVVNSAMVMNNHRAYATTTTITARKQQ